MFNDFILTVKDLFDTVKIVKPQASRQKSSEMYLLALGLKSKSKLQRGNLISSFNFILLGVRFENYFGGFCSSNIRPAV